MIKVLIVDDSFLQRKIIRNFFKQHPDVDVIEAVHGQDGLDKLSQEKVDIMVLDLLMPVMSGEETLKELKNRESKIPVIICSADIQDITKKNCLELGALRFINKPPKENELSEAFEAAIRCIQ